MLLIQSFDNENNLPLNYKVNKKYVDTIILYFLIFIVSIQRYIEII